MWLGKTQAGATSSGYVWPADGSVVQVPDEHAAELLAIQDAGFFLADAPQSDPGQDDEGGPDGDAAEDEASVEVTEPAPAPAAGEPVTEPAPKPRGRRPARG